MNVKKEKLSALNSSGINKQDNKNTKFLKIVTSRKKSKALAGESAAPGELAKIQEMQAKKIKIKKKKAKADVIQADEGTPTVAWNSSQEEECNATDFKAMGEKVIHKSTNKKKKSKKNVQGNTLDATIESEEPENIKISESTNNDVECDAAKDKKQENKNKQKQNKKNTKHVLFLGNLPYELEEGEVEEHFKVVKRSIKRVTLLTDKTTGLGRGCAFIEFTTPQAYQAALKLNQSRLKDHKIRVQFTTPGKRRNTTRKTFMKMKTKKILGQSKTGKTKRNKKGKT